MSTPEKNPSDSMPELPSESSPVNEVVEGIPEDINIPPSILQGENTSGEMSPAGEIFNPEIHVSPDSINAKTGRYRLKKGAKSGAQVSQESGDMRGEQFTDMFIGVGCMVMGSGFAPENKGEREPLDNAFTNWADANEIKDLPPNIALVLAIVAYSAGRVQKSQPLKDTLKERFKKVYTFIKSKINRKAQ